MQQIRTNHLRRLPLIAFFVLGLVWARVSAADTLTLEWDPDPEPEVTGYIVFVGVQSGNYTINVDVGNVTTYAFNTALPGTRYYFAVKAYSDTLQSPYSQEVTGLSNAVPTLTNPGNRTGDVGVSTTLQLQGADALGDALTYSATGLPPGLLLTQNLGLISGVPTTAGTFNIVATVSDGVLSASQSFTWTIRPANQPPVLTNPGNLTNDAGTALTLQLQATDTAGQTLTFSATGLPPGLTLTPSTGRITGTPTTVGTYNVTATVSDGSLSASRSFTWTIRPANVAPVLTNPGNRTSNVNQATSLQLVATDTAGQTLTFSATGLPAGLTLTPGTGLIAGTPPTAGTFSVTASVSDGSLSASQSFTWTVNAAPVLTNPGNQATDVNSSTALQLVATDTAGQTLTFSATGLPAGLGITPSTGRIAGTPTTLGTYNVTATVSDGSLSASQSFTWTIRAANQAPVLTYPGNQTGDVNLATALQLQASDPQGQTLTFSATGLPPGLGITAGTGLIAGTPTTAGTFNVTATVSDGTFPTSQSFVWTIRPANVTPVLTHPGNQTGDVNQATVLQLVASDTPGQTLTFSATGLPAGLALTPSTGRIAGTPTAAGTFNVTATVSDGSLSASQSFTWTIRPANVAPTLTNPGNQTGDVNLATALQLQASDTPGQALTFTATGLPPGLTLTPSTGRIAGTPITAGTYSVTATVGDGSLTASQSFSWTIRPANTAPTLAAPGNQTGDVNQPAALQLQASDTPGETLTFSATGLPPGLTLTAATGRIAGTPTTAGTFNTVASVTDGALTVGRSFTWTIRPVNTAPTLTNPGNQTGDVNQAVSLQLQASDTPGQALTFSATGLPQGLTIAGAGIAGTPTAAGAYAVTVSVSDGSLSASQSFTWTINGTITASVTPTATARNGRRTKTPKATNTGKNAVTREVEVVDTSTYTGSSAMSRTGTTSDTSGEVYTGAAVTRSVARATSSDDFLGGMPAIQRIPSGGEPSDASSASTANAALLSVTPASGASDASMANSEGTSQAGPTVRAAGTAPSVTIQTPVDATSFGSGATVIFSGTSQDAEDGDLGSRIVWSSSVDGRIGTGGTVYKVMSAGTHVITATVTDNAGISRSAKITIAVPAR